MGEEVGGCSAIHQLTKSGAPDHNSNLNKSQKICAPSSEPCAGIPGAVLQTHQELAVLNLKHLDGLALGDGCV